MLRLITFLALPPRPLSCPHPQDLAFLHKPSGTLIEADLLFNLPANEQVRRVPPGSCSSPVRASANVCY